MGGNVVVGGAADIAAGVSEVKQHSQKHSPKHSQQHNQQQAPELTPSQTWFEEERLAFPHLYPNQEPKQQEPPPQQKQQPQQPQPVSLEASPHHPKQPIIIGKPLIIGRRQSGIAMQSSAEESKPKPKGKAKTPVEDSSDEDDAHKPKASSKAPAAAKAQAAPKAAPKARKPKKQEVELFRPVTAHPNHYTVRPVVEGTKVLARWKADKPCPAGLKSFHGKYSPGVVTSVTLGENGAPPVCTVVYDDDAEESQVQFINLKLSCTLAEHKAPPTCAPTATPASSNTARSTPAREATPAAAASSSAKPKATRKRKLKESEEESLSASSSNSSKSLSLSTTPEEQTSESSDENRLVDEL